MQSENGRVMTRSKAANKVRMWAQRPGPSGSTGKKENKYYLLDITHYCKKGVELKMFNIEILVRLFVFQVRKMKGWRSDEAYVCFYKLKHKQRPTLLRV